MSLVSQRCPVWDFKPNITFENESGLPSDDIKVPTGLSSSSVPGPTYVTPARMVELHQGSTSGAGHNLGIVHGLTTAELSVRFPDFSRQWVQVSTGVPGRFWQFRGGDIYLDLSITVYVLEGDRPDSKDPISGQIFKIIYQHELLHVADEVDLVTEWMAAEAYRDHMVERYLTNAQTVDDSMLQTWFRGDHFADWLRTGVWTPEHNRRGGIRDAPKEYAALQDQINALRRKQINRP
jgi:hypothetical protein